MEVIKCSKIYRRRNYALFYSDGEKENKNFDKVLKYCKKCKYYDDEIEVSFCGKNGRMISSHFCPLKCPLGKFEIKE